MEKRKRFFRPEQFPHKTKAERLNSIAGLFREYHLQDYRYELSQWLYMALANDMGAYVDTATREDLIDFIEALQKLLESFYLLQLRSPGLKGKSKSPGISKEVKEMLEKINEPNLLDSDEKKQPVVVINAFCKAFNKNYVRAELLDLLNAVVTYQGSREVYKGGMVHFYYCLYSITTIAYRWS